jgi:hypothetical protein
MIQNLGPDNWHKLFETLKKGGFTFQEVETKKKRYLVWNKVKFYNDPNPPRLSLADLGRVSAAKREIIKNIDKVILPDMIGKDFFTCINKPYTYIYEFTANAIFGGDGPKYTQERKKTIYQGEAIQIDINSAYLTAVKNFGLLSKESYNKFYIEEKDEKQLIKKAGNSRYKNHNGETLKYSKDSRLIAIGALAQDKTIYYYSNGIKTHQERQYNEKHANVFWAAAAKVGEVMSEILKACNGFFYWVDAIFLPVDQAEKARQILKNNFYEFHEKKVLIKQEGGNFETICTETGDIKTYFVPPGKTVDFLETINNENFINEIFEAYKHAAQIYKDKPEKAEKARQITVRTLKKAINLESILNIEYLSKKALEIGHTLEQIIKIRTTITENLKDEIFQNDILETVIIERLEKLNNLQPLPAPEINLPDGKTIEREFLREFY